MQRFQKSTTTAGQLCALGIFFFTLVLQGCITTTVTCGDAGDNQGTGRGACAKQAPNGEQVNGVTCTGGLVCSNSGANCSRDNPPKKCKTVMLSGGTTCDCQCLP